LEFNAVYEIAARCHAISKLHFASFIFRTVHLRQHIQELHIRYLTRWNNSISDYKLNTNFEQLRLKIPKIVKNNQPQLKIYWFLF